MADYSGTFGAIDIFGVDPQNNSGDIKTLGSPTETSGGGVFGFLSKVADIAKQGAEVYGTFNANQAEEEYGQDTSVVTVNSKTNIPSWVIPAVLVVVAVIAVVGLWKLVK